jgi:hypothetical protein
MNGRSIDEMSTRWRKVLDPVLIKGSFTQEEDAMITQLVKEHGDHSWREIGTFVPKRTSEPCRDRWRNHLDPSLNHGPWTADEDACIFTWHQTLGSQWSKIAVQLPRRAESSVKN